MKYLTTKRNKLKRIAVAFLASLMAMGAISLESTNALERDNHGENSYNINFSYPTNIDKSIPKSSIINQEIVYVVGVPVLFETYKDSGFIVDIVSLLEPSSNGYRIIMAGEEINSPMPRNFIDAVSAVHHERIGKVSSF